MKKIVLLLPGGSLCIAGLYVALNRLRAEAQTGCCQPPVRNPMVPRFPPHTTVNVFIDASTGFTSSEIQSIETGIESWNGQPNNADITYNVITDAPPPPPGTGNTIVVSYDDHQSNALADVQVFSSGPNVSMTMVFHAGIRSGLPESLPQLVREVSKHEAGHGLGLDNADDCPPGSTIMRVDVTDANEDQITDCDNAAINSDPAYPAPTPTPTPPPESCPVCPNADWSDCPSNCITGRDPCMHGPSGCPSVPGMQATYCWCYRPSPIVVDVSGNGFNLTSGPDGVNFDLIGDGMLKRHSWTSANSDDAWLALDRNGNGVIDNGTELFGTATPQPAPPPGIEKHGFLALAQYDQPQNGGNGDGLINNLDAIFPSLRLWQDVNHNGVSESSELKTLLQLGLKTLELNYKTSKKVDQFGNEFRYRAKVKDIKGAQVGRWAWDVFLVSDQ